MTDEHTYEQKMARNGRLKVIYKGTFVLNQSLILIAKEGQLSSQKILTVTAHMKNDLNKNICTNDMGGKENR